MMSNTMTINISTIGAFTVIKDVLAILEAYQGMITRDQQSLQAQYVISTPPNAELARMDWKFLPLLRALNADQVWGCRGQRIKR